MIVSQLTCQLSELKRERELLLDRLATIGLGGPLFNLPLQQDSSQSTEAEEELIESPEQEVQGLISRFRHRPQKFVDAMAKKAWREHNKPAKGPDVAWIPQAAKIDAALDAAEEEGKKRA